jgi:hypothetical protein
MHSLECTMFFVAVVHIIKCLTSSSAVFVLWKYNLLIVYVMKYTSFCYLVTETYLTPSESISIQIRICVIYARTVSNINTFSCSLKCQVQIFGCDAVRTNHNHISLTECNSNTIQKLRFGINPMIELKNVITTSHDTGTLFSRNTPRWKTLMPEVVVIFFSSIVVLTPSGQFLDCTTIAFSEWYYAYVFIFYSDLVRNLACGI